MTLLNIFRIVIRVLCGISVAGFFWGGFLYNKHKIFKKIFEIVGCIMIVAGMVLMWYVAIFGF